MVVSNGVASVLRCPSLVRYAPNSDQNVAEPRLSAMCQEQTSHLWFNARKSEQLRACIGYGSLMILGVFRSALIS